MRVEIEISEEEAEYLRDGFLGVLDRPETSPGIRISGRLAAALPRAIQVGDKVVYVEIVYTVVAMDGGYAWVKVDANGGYGGNRYNTIPVDWLHVPVAVAGTETQP